MAVFDIFSKKQKALRGDVPDVYTYNSVPQSLRVQIIHILRDTLGNGDEYENQFAGQVYEGYKFIVETLCREYGLFVLPGTQQAPRGRHCLKELVEFPLNKRDTERILDAVQLSFQIIDRSTRRWDTSIDRTPLRWQMPQSAN
jgi:hypothetical protein